MTPPPPPPAAATATPSSIGTVYDRTAPHYWLLTGKDDYTTWTGLIDRVIRAAGPPGLRFLDGGCGAGRSSRHFHRLGYEVTGIDASAAMIDLARTDPDATPVDFHVHDIRERFGVADFDIANCMSDVVNYLTSAADVTAAFGALRDALRPGGILVFDVNTERGYALATSETSVIDKPEVFVSWRGRRLPAEEPQRYQLILDAFTPGADAASWQRETVIHEQAHHSHADLVGYLWSAGLTVDSVYAMTRDGNAEPLEDPTVGDHTKLIYVARRPVDQ